LSPATFADRLLEVFDVGSALVRRRRDAPVLSGDLVPRIDGVIVLSVGPVMPTRSELCFHYDEHVIEPDYYVWFCEREARPEPTTAGMNLGEPRRRLVIAQPPEQHRPGVDPDQCAEDYRRQRVFDLLRLGPRGSELSV
jgi:hypothetical protein